MTKEQLNGHSIFALREFARRTGVASPTSKSKEKLIEDILDISEGRKLPHIPKTRQGRPPKNYGYPIVDLFVTGQAQTLTPTILKQNVTPVNYQTEELDVYGYAEVINPLQTLLWVLKDGVLDCNYIPNSLSSEYGIKTGDYVFCGLGTGENSNQVKEIYAINSVPLKKHKKDRLHYSQLPAIRPKNTLSFSNEEYQKFGIELGSSAYIYGSNNNDVSQTVIDLLNDCQADARIYINISLVEKNKFLLDEIGSAEKFVCDLVEEAEVSRRVVMLATERAKRLLERGKNVVIAVDDVQSLMADTNALAQTKSLMALPKATENGTITLLAVMGRNFVNANSIFEKLADKRLQFDKQLNLI